MNLSDIVSIKMSSNQKKSNCQKCVYKDRPFVASSIADSEIVIVGDAPSNTEASMKSLFIGDSGRLLRRLLNEVGLDEKKVTYTNIVCCNPPDNEKLKKKATILCPTLFLMNDLEKMKPKVVVLSGSVALDYFFPGEKIMDKRGTLLQKDNMTFFPIIDPAYCFNNKNAESILRRDLNKIRLWLGGLLYNDRQYIVADTEEKLWEYKKLLLSKEIISVDIETNRTLDPFSEGAKIWTVSFGYAKDTAVCIVLDHPEANLKLAEKAKAVVSEVLKSKVKKVMHNCPFDVKWLRKFGFTVNAVYADTMVMSYLLNEHRTSNSLKVLAPEFVSSYQFQFVDGLKGLAQYNCEDADYTLQLYYIFYESMAKLPKLWCLFEKIVMPFCQVIAEMELNGIMIDQEYSKKLKDIYEKKLLILRDAIKEDYPATKTMDIDSPKQLSELLFKKLKYKPIKETKTGYSVDHEVLVKLAEQKCGLAKYVLGVRKMEKSLSTYINKIPTMVSTDGRLRGGFNIVGTRTGRLSSSKPNLQNIPRDVQIKKMFVASEQNEILNIDASQAELRVGCSIANELTMIKAYNEGMDIHTLTASKILNKKIEDVTKIDRQKAKGVNFGFIYGQSSEGFQNYAENTYGLKLSLKECSEFRLKFFRLYSGFLSWYTRTEGTLRRYGFIEYPTGRIARFPEAKGVGDMPPSILRQAVNYPVQGSSSDIVLYTMVCLQRFLNKAKLDAKMIVTVHDSIVIECKKGLGQEIYEEVCNISQYDITKTFPWMKVPMKFDHAIGRSWGELGE